MGQKGKFSKEIGVKTAVSDSFCHKRDCFIISEPKERALAGEIFQYVSFS